MAKDIKVALELDSRQFDNSLRTSTKNVGAFERSSTSSFAKSAAAAAVFATAMAGVKKGLNIAATFQDLQSSLTTVFGGLDEGAAAFNRVTDIASRTQFQVEDITKAFIQLKGAGIEPTEETIMTFANAAAITTDQIGAFQAAISLLSRTTAGGLGLEELERLGDRGIPVYEILNKKLGITRLQISDVGKTAEGAAKIIKALGDGINEQFGDALANRMANTNQRISNFNDALAILANSLLSDANVGFGELLANLTETVKGLNENIEKVIKFTGAIVDFAKALGLIFIGNKIASFTGSFVTNLGKVGASTAKSLVGFTALKTGLTALGRQFGFIAMKTSKLSGGARLVLGFGSAIAGLSVGLGVLLAVTAAFAALFAVLEKPIGAFDKLKESIDRSEIATERLQERLDKAKEKLAKYQEQGDRGKMGGGTSYIDNAQKQVDKLTLKLAESQKELKDFQQQYKDGVGIVGPPLPPGFEKSVNEPLSKLAVFLNELDDAVAGVNENFRSEEQFRIYIDALKELESQITSNQEWIEYEKRVKDVETAFGMTVESLDPMLKRMKELQEDMSNVENFEEYRAVLDAINQAYKDGDLDLASYRQALALLEGSLTDAEIQLSIFQDAFQDIDSAISDDLVNALFEGENAIEAMKNTFKEAIKQMIADTIRLAIVQTALTAIFGAFGYGVSFAASGGITDVTKKRAGGGPVMANKPYIVGETGPELFMPSQAGNIERNGSFGGGGTAVTYNIQAVDAPSFQSLIARDPGFLHAIVSKAANDLPSGRRF